MTEKGAILAPFNWEIEITFPYPNDALEMIESLGWMLGHIHLYKDEYEKSIKVDDALSAVANVGELISKLAFSVAGKGDDFSVYLSQRKKNKPVNET